MKSEQRDYFLLQKIVKYCSDADEIIAPCGGQKEIFLSDRTCRYACAMCIFQVGELAGRLSDDAKSQMGTIVWSAVRGMRNVLAHDYISVNWDVIWLTATNDLPILKLACENYLKTPE